MATYFLLFILYSVAVFRANSNSIVLDKDGRYVVHWSLKNEDIIFKIEVEAKGYVGFGISKNGAMKGSDIFTAWIADGQIHSQDRHGEGNFLPPIDKENNWVVTLGYENDTHTVLEVKRKLNTCDDQDVVIDESTTKLIYAYSNKKPSSPNDLEYHHQNKGARNALLWQLQSDDFHPPEDLKYWDVLSPNFTLDPNRSTIYRCGVYKSPAMQKKHHIVKIEPRIAPGLESVVHHMIFYECVGGKDNELEPYVNGPGFECRTSAVPPPVMKCDAMLAATAIGGTAIVLPDYVGLPVEEKNYYSLEIHYNNPNGLALTDMSGFRLFYTAHLREFDAGSLMLGAVFLPTLLIPPGQENYTIVGHSSPTCFENVMPADGLKIIGVGLHSHLLGRQIRGRHFRQNEELKPLSIDRNYDFNYQNYIMFDKGIDILPGDLITAECVYNSTNRTKVTMGGYAATDEMCLLFIIYYPRIDVATCLSFPNPMDIIETIGIDQIPNITHDLLVYLNTDNLNIESVRKTFENVNWSRINVPEMESRLMFSDHIPFVVDGSPHVLVENSVSYPKNYKPYVEASVCDISSGSKCFLSTVILTLSLIHACI